MNITKRIYSTCSHLEGYKLVDIGTDHCILPIFAILSGQIDFAIGVDVNAGPLNIARENVKREGLLDKIELRLGDGFSPISIGECDCAVITGMGGTLISNIIENGIPVARRLSQLILSPQSDAALLRKSLHKFGFEIYREDMVKDGTKFYPLIVARAYSKSSVSFNCDFEYEFGKLMLENPNDDFYEYLEALRIKNQNIIDRNPLEEDRKAEILGVNRFIKEFINS